MNTGVGNIYVQVGLTTLGCILLLLSIETTLTWNYPDATCLLMCLDALTNVAVAAITAD